MPIPSKRVMSSSTSRPAKSSKTVVSRKPKYNNVVSNIVKVPRGAFPVRMQNTLRYVEEVQISCNAVGYGGYVFSTLGLHDPNTTGTGHQPMYYDQMIPIYNHYTVLYSTFKGTIVRGSVAGDVNAVFSMDDDADANATSYTTVAERAGAVLSHGDPSQGAYPTGKLYYNAATVFGPNPTSIDKLIGTAGANPSEGHFFMIQVEGPPNGTVNLVVEINYTAVWSELKSVTGS